MKPASNLYYPPSGLSFEILQRAGRSEHLDGRPRLRPQIPSLMDLPPGHERILVKVLAPHSPYRVGDILIFETPIRRHKA